MPMFSTSGVPQVSIHALARGRTITRAPVGLLVYGFNPRPRARANPDSASSMFDDEAFQSTPSREGERQRDPLTEEQKEFQSTPSREGEPASPVDGQGGHMVSIHALARGRTMSSSPSAGDMS